MADTIEATMERLQKKLDGGTYAKLTGHLINNHSLWDLSTDDLTSMGVTEVGPRRIILNFIERNREAPEYQSENVADNGQDMIINESSKETIQSILAKDLKFQKTLTNYLNCGLVPDGKKLLQMNRILTDHFFGHMMFREKRYPTWQQKHELAVHILDEFPHLKHTRVTENAPPESYFFWVHGGMNTGSHTGIIESRVSNMRKEVSPEDRKFLRGKKKKIVIDDEQINIAAHVSALSAIPANAKQIAEGMSLAHNLLEVLLQDKTSNAFQNIIDRFPHFLSFEGEMIIQAFDRIRGQVAIGPSLNALLRTGLLCDKSSWSEVEDDVLRGTLRLMKTLSNKGIKRTPSTQNATISEMAAEPLIKWINFPHRECGFDERLAVKHTSCSTMSPHIVCVADSFKRGSYYVTIEASVIACGTNFERAIEVLFKSFVVFGIEVPPLLRKLDAMISTNVWGSKAGTRYKSVTELTSRFREYLNNSSR